MIKSYMMFLIDRESRKLSICLSNLTRNISYQFTDLDQFLEIRASIIVSFESRLKGL